MQENYLKISGLILKNNLAGVKTFEAYISGYERY